MRRSLLFVAAWMISCGARTEVRDAPAFDVIYLADHAHIARWHSATGALDFVPTTRVPYLLRCTRDGRFMAISDLAAVQFDEMDRNGSVLRSHTGFADAIRPDGARLLVSDYHFPASSQESCVGTLDADGTYEDVSCKSNSSHDFFAPVDYSSDGSTVLWVDTVVGESWTLGTAREDAGDWRPLVTVSGPAELDDARWSPDGMRFAFATHVPQLPHDVSKLSIVRMDTLDVETLIDDAPLITSFGFTPDGRYIVFVEDDIVDGLVVSAEARMIDLGTRAIAPLAIPVDPYWVDSICVTSD